MRELERGEKFDKNKAEVYLEITTHLGEIGLNPLAVISRNMLENEKVYGTCHLAIGANYDEDAHSINNHYDCLIKNPTINVFRNGR